MNTETGKENGKSAERMWNTLEQDQQVPENIDLHYLSGLLEEDQVRMEHTWSLLPTKTRQNLIRKLTEVAEADYEMDFAYIFRLALNDPDAEVRANAIEGLWEDEDVRLVSPLTRHLLTDSDLRVRLAAAQTLARFILLGELGKIRSRPFEVACQALIQAYYKPGEQLDVRRRALESLAYASIAEVPRMIEDAYQHSEETLRISAVFAMGRSADRHRWGNTVMQELINPNPNMRYEAARACGELEIREAVRDLIDLVEDVDPEVQEAALWALSQIGGDLARRTLERYLRSDSEALREAAHDALQELEFYHGNPNTFFKGPVDFSAHEEPSEPWESEEEDDDEEDLLMEFMEDYDEDSEEEPDETDGDFAEHADEGE